MNFWKSAKAGEGSFSIQKFMLQILGTLNMAFWAWNWYKWVISGLRVCFFNNCIEKKIKTKHTLKKALVVIPVFGTGYQNWWIFGKVPNGRWPPPLRMVPISGNHVHAFHTIWPSYLLCYSYPIFLRIANSLWYWWWFFVMSLMVYNADLLCRFKRGSPFKILPLGDSEFNEKFLQRQNFFKMINDSELYRLCTFFYRRHIHNKLIWT